MKFVLFVALFVFQLVYAKVLSSNEKLADFVQLNLAIDAGYGPLLYKQKVRGLNLSEVREKYRAEILNTKSNGEFYYTMMRYISEFHDGHFGAILPSDYKAEIAISTDLIDGKVLVDSIDRNKLSEKDFPFAKGDEVISFDGKPVDVVVTDLSQYMGGGFVLSERRTAAQALFSRSGRRFPVPTGSVEVEIRRGTSDIIEKVKLNWVVSGTPFDEKMSIQGFRPSPLTKTSYDSLSIVPDLKAIFGPERLEKSFRCSGTTRIAIPEGATVVVKDPFIAYYHPTAKGNVGYLRIPHYFFQNPEDVLKKYEYAVQILEQNTVGLVIDQDHNCGGSVTFLHDIVSLFISEPVRPMQFELLSSKASYFDFKSWVDQIPVDTLYYMNLKKVLALIKNTWEAGDFLTSKTSIDGGDLIHPNPHRYTKPIVMLIDELSGSGGDAFPAIMGGNGRATLFGTRTWGLGGHVESLSPLYHSGMNVQITKSLFYRPDGVAVENNGAVPDIQYTPTRNDFMFGYRNYQKAYLKVLLDKIQ